MKYIQFQADDGSWWEVPALVVANNRATYYAAREPGVYTEEYTYTIENDDELIDWAQNNMNWDDVKDKATMFCGPPSLNMQAAWTNGHMEVADR